MTKKGPRSEELWKQIRAEWERGASKKELADKYGVTTQAIYNHEKKDEWLQIVDAIDAIAGIEPVADDPVIADPEPVSAKDQARIAELETELADALAKVKEYRPTADAKIPSTPEGWVEYLGEEKISDLVEAELATENVERFRKGLPQLDINDNPELKAKQIRELLAKLEAAKTKHISLQHIARTIKVVKPSTDGSIRLAQIIVEEQVSNEKGQQGAAMWKARDKGYKLADPYLCQLLNCWLEAAVDTDGKMPFQGYCSAEHMALDPYIGKKQVEGVTTSAIGGFGS